MASGNTGSDSISFVRSFVRPSLSIPEREVPLTDEIHGGRHMGNSGNPVIITCRTPLRHAWNRPAYGVGFKNDGMTSILVTLSIPLSVL